MKYNQNIYGDRAHTFNVQYSFIFIGLLNFSSSPLMMKRVLRNGLFATAQVEMEKSNRHSFSLQKQNLCHFQYVVKQLNFNLKQEESIRYSTVQQDELLQQISTLFRATQVFKSSVWTVKNVMRCFI